MKIKISHVIIAFVCLLLLVSLQIVNLKTQDEVQNNFNNSNIINIVSAEHLDKDKNFISDIYQSVSSLDDVWSNSVKSGEYVRVKFEKNLTNVNDITIFPIVKAGNPSIKVYSSKTNMFIGEFNDLEENRYNKLLLSNLEDREDIFYLYIEGGDIEFDHIIDPTTTAFYDNFAGDLTKWDGNGATAWDIVTSQAHDETHSLLASNGNEGDAITDDIDTSTATEINVSFWFRDDDLDSGDIDFYFFDGTNYDAITESLETGTEDTWQFVSFTTTDSQYFTSNFRVRFNAVVGSAENFWVDQLNVTMVYPVVSSYYRVNLTDTININVNNTDQGAFTKRPVEATTINSKIGSKYSTKANIVQGLLFSSVFSRSRQLTKETYQAFTITSISNRIAGLFRAPAQTLNIIALGERMSTLMQYFNNIIQQILSNLSLGKSGAYGRSTNQQIYFNTLTGRIAGLFKSPLQFFSFNSNSNRILGASRSTAQTISFNSLTSRITGLFKLPNQIFNINNLAGKSYAATRSTSQSFTIAAVTTRLANIFRAPLGILNFTSSMLERLGLTRSPNAQFSVSPVTGKIAGFSRTQSTTLSFNTLTGRIAGLFKLPNQIFNINNLAGKSYAATRATSQAFTITSISNRIAGLFKSPLQFFSFNSNSNRILGASRSTNQQISLADFTSRLASLFKRPFDQLGFSSSSSRTYEVTRGTSQTISFNTLTGRFTGLFRAPQEIFTVRNVVTRFGGMVQFIIDVADRMGIVNSVNRLANIFRGMSDWFQYLLSILTGQGTATSQSSTSSNSGGGGGGGSTSTGTSKSGLTISPGRLSISIKQGEVKKSEITITNPGVSIRHLELSTPDLERFTKFSKTSIDIAPGQSITIPVTFLIEETTRADVYIGKIIIESSGVKDEILVALTISSKKPLFDVKATIPDKFLNVLPGESVLAEINIFNLGQIGTVDVNIEYTLMNDNKEIISVTHETIAVQTQASFLKNFDIPKGLAPGNYLVYIKTIYGEGESQSVASASAWFTVKSGQFVTTQILVTILLVLVLGLISTLVYIRHRKINFHKHESKRYTIRHRVLNRGLMIRRRLMEKIHHKIIHGFHTHRIKKSLNSKLTNYKRVKK